MPLPRSSLSGRHLRPITAGAVALLLATIATSAAYVGGRVYRNPALRIQRIEVPRTWELTPATQIPYPRLLILASSGPARLTFGAQRIIPETKAVDLAATARAVLVKQDWEDPRITPVGEDRVRLDASRERGHLLLRQIYLVDGDLGYVATVYTPLDRRDRAYRDLDEFVKSLVITPPALVAPDGGPDGGPTTDGGTRID